MKHHFPATALVLAMALSVTAEMAAAESATVGKPETSVEGSAMVQGSAPAAMANVIAEDPAAIIAAMQAAGYRAELTTDSRGDPRIQSSGGGADYSVYFYGCTDGKGCTSIQLSAGFDLTDGTTLQVANDWNAQKRFAKTYLDSDMDPWLEMDINLEYGGISQDTFRDTLEMWDRLIADFKTHINW